jgi:hypothetical protein
VVDKTYKSDSTKWHFLRDVNVQFNTFQTQDNAQGVLGCTYDVNYSYAKFEEEGLARNSSSFGIVANGNIAFQNKLNPNDFLETKINYSFSRFYGGVVKSKDDTSVFTRLNRIEDALVMLDDMKSKEAQALWSAFARSLVLSNQYYFSVVPKLSMESNQSFSKSQYVAGFSIDLGAKAWNNKSRLACWNILDYPFAILRYISGTDQKLTVYGSTLPTAQVSLDYVIPSNDTLRKSIEGNLNPFPRLKFESGFRTLVARVKNESVYFDANIRYYQEVNASESIRKAHLANHLYYVMALQSSSGFYVSYTNGKLPFDVKNDQVYAIGFNYKF